MVFGGSMLCTIIFPLCICFWCLFRIWYTVLQWFNLLVSFLSSASTHTDCKFIDEITLDRHLKTCLRRICMHTSHENLINKIKARKTKIEHRAVRYHFNCDILLLYTELIGTSVITHKHTANLYTMCFRAVFLSPALFFFFRFDIFIAFA